MNSNKTKISQMINVNSNTTSERFYNPGYSWDPYFGASTFYGDQSRLHEFNYDGTHRDRPYFIHSMYKAIGRQFME